MNTMKALIRDFPEQLAQALMIGASARFLLKDADGSSLQNVFLLGMGGSAFGGEVVKSYVADKCRLPFLIHRSYTIPASVTEASLVVVSSYSGNTEETITAAESALYRKARLVCIASGGKLKAMSEAHGLPFIELPQGYPPRTACGFSIVQQLLIFSALGLIPDPIAEIRESISFLRETQKDVKKEARALGEALKGKLPVVYSGDEFESIALRFTQQINENAKSLCHYHVTPEMNHNELVGWRNPKGVLKRTAALIIRSSFDHPRVTLRHAIAAEIIEDAAGTLFYLDARGETRLQQLFYLLHFSDWVSFYLAKAYKVAPMPVEVIDKLKVALDEKK